MLLGQLEIFGGVFTPGPFSLASSQSGYRNPILINGAVEAVPDALLSQLAEGGRLVAVVRDGAIGRARVYLREKGVVGSRPDFDSGTPLLTGFRRVVGFVF